jgi:hypothetical protein
VCAEPGRSTSFGRDISVRLRACWRDPATSILVAARAVPGLCARDPNSPPRPEGPVNRRRAALGIQTGGDRYGPVLP